MSAVERDWARIQAEAIVPLPGPSTTRTLAGVAVTEILESTVALSVTTEFRDARNRVDFILFHPDSRVPKEKVAWTYEAMTRAADVAGMTRALLADLPAEWKAPHAR